MKKRRMFDVFMHNNLMVRERGLEPPRLATLAPQASLSTNFSTRAKLWRHYNIPPQEGEYPAGLAQYVFFCLWYDVGGVREGRYGTDSQ